MFEFHNQLKVWTCRTAGLEALVMWQLKKLGRPQVSVSVLFCGDKRSADLNRRFRNKTEATDILSFPAKGGRVALGSREFIGDLALNLPLAWRKRNRFASSFEQEIAFLLVHGLVHLLGYHHDTPAQEKTMEALVFKAFPIPAELAKGLGVKRK